MPSLAVELDDVRKAAERLEGVAHRTPVLRSRLLDARVGAEVHLKAENLQRVGAFKFRGAFNAIAALAPDERARGVVTASSGNHAQAVALAAKLHGVPATVVMPADAPAAKVAATRAYGAEIIEYDRYGENRDGLLDELASKLGRVAIHAFEHPDVIAGQGTVALELLEQSGALDVLVVPVGGGGLIAGCATVARALSQDVRVIGVEPEAGDDTRRSLAAGERVAIPVPRTIADGQQVPMPGAVTFPVVQARVDDVVTVSDQEIVAAMAVLLELLKTVAEPSGASALAALLAERVGPVAGKRVGVVISGGNISAQRLAELMG